MTRKDFVLIAAALKSARVHAIFGTASFENRSLYNNGVDNAVHRVADALATTNPAFDRARFLTACGFLT